MAERHVEIERSDYQIGNQYNAKHKDALADGDTMGRGTKPEGHSDWKPSLRGETNFSQENVNHIDYTNFDTNPKAENTPGTSEDRAMRQTDTVKSLYSWLDPYDEKHPDAKANGDMIGRGTKPHGHGDWKPSLRNETSFNPEIANKIDYSNFDTDPAAENSPGTIADRYMRAQDTVKSLYSWGKNKSYDEKHPDAKATGNMIGRGTGSIGHTDWQPNCKKINEIDYRNFDTSEAAGTIGDQSMRKKLLAKNIFSPNNRYVGAKKRTGLLGKLADLAFGDLLAGQYSLPD